MMLICDQEGRYWDDIGNPIVPYSFNSSHLSEIKRCVPGLPNACLSEFEKMLTIWRHPWVTEATNLRPSAAKTDLQAIEKLLAGTAAKLAKSLRKPSVQGALGEYTERLSNLQQELNIASERVAKTYHHIPRGKTGANARDAHSFVGEIDEILFARGLLLVNSRKRGTDFIGLVACLLEIAGFTYPVRKGQTPVLARYAGNLVRAQITRRERYYSRLELKPLTSHCTLQP